MDPPISPIYKINFDRAFFSELDAIGLRVVICDSSSQVIGALSERISIPISMATVEPLACRKALIFAEELSIFKAVYEGNVEVIIKALLAGEVDQPEYGHVIQDTFV